MIGKITPKPSFDRLVRPHLDGLFRIAFRLTEDRHNAEDLLQDVLVKLYPRRHELTKIETLRPWMARVLYNQFIDQKRRYARNPLQLAVTMDPNDQEGDPLDAMESGNPGPETLVQQESELDTLQAALARMTPDHRMIVTLHDIEGYTQDELQEILGISLGTVKSRLHRARARLREILFEGTK